MALFIETITKFLVITGFLMLVTLTLIIAVIIYGVIYDYFHNKKLRREEIIQKEKLTKKTIASIQYHTYKYDIDID